MTTKTRPAETTLEERTARVAAEAAEIRAEQEARAREEYRQLTEHQAAVDEETVNSYNRAAYETAVVEARAALERAIAEHPLTKALCDYYVAMAQRRLAFDTYIGARGRQGHDVSSASYPGTEAVDLLERMTRIAEQAGTAARAEAEAAWHERYANPDHTDDRSTTS